MYRNVTFRMALYKTRSFRLGHPVLLKQVSPFHDKTSFHEKPLISRNTSVASDCGHFKRFDINVS